MIKKYLKGLPYNLTQPMFREFEAKCRELDRWTEQSHSERLRPFLRQKVAMQELIAMGIYYRYVVAPLSSSADFFDRLQDRAQNASLKVGGRVIDEEFRSKIVRGAARFEMIAREFGLPLALFGQSDISAFVLAVVNIELRGPDAAQQ